MRKIIFLVFMFLFSGFISLSYACTAKNDVGDTCETNCLPGQVASCSNGTGANAPVCSCSNATFVFPEGFNSLPDDQKSAIRNVLIKNKLITESGTLTDLTEDDIPKKTKSDLDKAFSSSNIKPQSIFDNINPKCIAARALEAVAVGACASVPGGQVAIAICIAAAHEAANQACN